MFLGSNESPRNGLPTYNIQTDRQTDRQTDVLESTRKKNIYIAKGYVRIDITFKLD